MAGDLAAAGRVVRTAAMQTDHFAAFHAFGGRRIDGGDMAAVAAVDDVGIRHIYPLLVTVKMVIPQA